MKTSFVLWRCSITVHCSVTPFPNCFSSCSMLQIICPWPSGLYSWTDVCFTSRSDQELSSKQFSQIKKVHYYPDRLADEHKSNQEDVCLSPHHHHQVSTQLVQMFWGEQERAPASIPSSQFVLGWGAPVFSRVFLHVKHSSDVYNHFTIRVFYVDSHLIEHKNRFVIILASIQSMHPAD